MTRLALAITAAGTVAVVGVMATAATGDAGGPAPERAPHEIVLTARHSRFTPARVTVERGTTVRFVVRNLDPIDHELIVGDAATHRRHRTGREAHHHGDVAGEVSVPAGRTASTTVRFDRPGTVVFACHLPGHLDYGMAGTIVVTT